MAIYQATTIRDKMETMARKKYSDDYELVITEDEKGREKRTAVYRGDYFEVELDREGFTKFKKTCLLLIAAIFIIHIGGGLINTQGMYQFYISLPYVFVFFPLLYLTESVFRLPKEKRKFRREEIGRSYEQLKTTSIITISFLAFTILGEILFIIFSPEKIYIGLELLFLVLEIIVGIAVFFVLRLHKQISIKAVP